MILLAIMNSAASGSSNPVGSVQAKSKASNSASAAAVHEHHPYSLRFPKGQPLEDEMAEEARQGRRECCMSVIDAMIQDDSIGLPLWQKVVANQKRKRGLDSDFAHMEVFLVFRQAGALMDDLHDC